MLTGGFLQPVAGCYRAPQQFGMLPTLECSSRVVFFTVGSHCSVDHMCSELSRVTALLLLSSGAAVHAGELAQKQSGSGCC